MKPGERIDRPALQQLLAIGGIPVKTDSQPRSALRLRLIRRRAGAGRD
jgi:hypothetical protein